MPSSPFVTKLHLDGGKDAFVYAAALEVSRILSHRHASHMAAECQGRSLPNRSNDTVDEETGGVITNPIYSAQSRQTE